MSLSPRSSLSSLVSWDMDSGKVLNKFSRSSTLWRLLRLSKITKRWCHQMNTNCLVLKSRALGRGNKGKLCTQARDSLNFRLNCLFLEASKRVIRSSWFSIGFYLPKSRGRELRDMSFNPRTVRFFNWTNPAGSLGMGLLLKSATCRALTCLIVSGMSDISVPERKIKSSLTVKAQIFTYNKCYGLRVISNK